MSRSLACHQLGCIDAEFGEPVAVDDAAAGKDGLDEVAGYAGTLFHEGHLAPDVGAAGDSSFVDGLQQHAHVFRLDVVDAEANEWVDGVVGPSADLNLGEIFGEHLAFHFLGLEYIQLRCAYVGVVLASQRETAVESQRLAAERSRSHHRYNQGKVSCLHCYSAFKMYRTEVLALLAVEGDAVGDGEDGDDEWEGEDGAETNGYAERHPEEGAGENHWYHTQSRRC